MEMGVLIATVELVKVQPTLPFVLTEVLVPRVDEEPAQVDVVGIVPHDVCIGEEFTQEIFNQIHRWSSPLVRT
jgi:hypothetical protein